MYLRIPIPAFIVMACSVPSFLLTPPDQVSFLIEWCVMSVGCVVSYYIGLRVARNKSGVEDASPQEQRPAP